MGPIGSVSALDVAAEHLELVSEPVRELDRSAAIDLGALASRHSTWPSWPMLHLSSLIGPPAVVLDRIDLSWLHRFEAMVSWLDALGHRLGGPVGGPTGLSLLVERAAMLGHRGWGRTSAGTSCRLIDAADGSIAVNLARDEDIASVPAWLEDDAGADPVWDRIERMVAERAAGPLVERAALLGMAVSSVAGAEPTTDPQRLHRDPDRRWRPALVELGHEVEWRRPLRVVDCSSLWAGPLCGWYLARAGADVLKVESSRRPDGARRGTPAFWRRLNHNKTFCELDLTTSDGVSELRRLVAGADIVIEASRPRAMANFGIDARAEVERGAIWCSLTGYGREGPWFDRVAFGDDAAAAGGLVVDVGQGPWFIGDAAADPIAGVSAASAALGLVLGGRCGFIDVALRDAVASLTKGRPVTAAGG